MKRMNNFRNSRKTNRLSISKVFGFLNEAEGDEKKDEPAEGGDEPAEDLFGEEPAAGDEKKDEPAGEEKPAGEEGGEKKEKKDEEEKIVKNLSPKEQAELEDDIGNEIDVFLQNAEEKARNKAAFDTVQSKRRNESLRRVYKKVLKEASADDIDIDTYSEEVARLVKNYSTLLDIENIIINRAKAYLEKYYGEETSKAFEIALEKGYDLKVDEPLEEDEPRQYYATGARSAGAA